MVVLYGRPGGRRPHLAVGGGARRRVPRWARALSVDGLMEIGGGCRRVVDGEAEVWRKARVQLLEAILDRLKEPWSLFNVEQLNFHLVPRVCLYTCKFFRIKVSFDFINRYTFLSSKLKLGLRKKTFQSDITENWGLSFS